MHANDLGVHPSWLMPAIIVGNLTYGGLDMQALGHHQRLKWRAPPLTAQRNQDAPGGRRRQPGEGILEGVSTP